MPPRKSVRTLKELSLAASSELVLHSCKRIEAEVSSDADFDLPFDSNEYKNAVETLRQHLRRFVTLVIWETFFNTVLELYKNEKDTTLDEITLYKVFVFNEVNFNKFTMPSVCTDMATLRPQRVEFWVECAAMLPNIVEVDLRYVYCDQITEAFCQSSTKLQIITLPYLGKTQLERAMQLLTEKCKQLKEIRRENEDYVSAPMQRVLEELVHLERLDYCCFGNILENERTNRNLKLKKLILCLNSSKQVDDVAKLCPDLEELDMYTGLCNAEVICTETFQTLTSSLLKISKLKLKHFDINSDVFDAFLSAKGRYITALSIKYSAMIGTPRSFLEMLSKCPNLTKFTVLYLRGLTAEHLATSPLVRQISFPNLEHLAISQYDNAIQSISLATKFIEHSQKVSSLTLWFKREVSFFCNEPLIDLEEPLKRLFTSPMIRQLKKLEVSCGAGYKEVTAHLMRHVIASCPIMTSLSIPNPSEDAKLYATHLRRVVKNNTIDFYMDLKDDSEELVLF